MSIKLENNKNKLSEQFKKIQAEIDISLHSIEVKLAKIISDSKNSKKIKEDFNSLKKILDETEKNLNEIKNMMK